LEVDRSKPRDRVGTAKLVVGMNSSTFARPSKIDALLDMELLAHRLQHSPSPTPKSFANRRRKTSNNASNVSSNMAR
jgi:hypothetical protein